ncbi:hypothetical protein NDS46_14065 [Paenibacillus thiaminolyticus]|uniref:hypothetical protein n=1 Tax=Paenibacillus thiaminolyticus TaxID=49283 RepID=UPI00232A82C6|nr:hypothetical protein [Paenibacillus thiaminolyticus]WCF10896.1 hypothetical protein NDS46_14065 [Paenibacillus thiaminolyticus]
MTKCWLLLKVQLLGFFNINRTLRTNDKKEKRRLVVMGAVMLFVLIIMVGYSAGMAIAFAHFGMADVLPPLILIVCAACTLVITFLKSNGVLFGFRDYDMVMSLPVKNSTIIISRLLSVYAMNFLISGVIMLPSIIVYGITYSVSLSVWCMLMLSLFLASLLPMIISMIAGVIITAISVRFRYKNLLTIALSTAAILALLVGSFAIPQEEAALTELVASAVQTVYRIYPVAELYTNALTNNDWGSFGQYALISVGASVLFVMLLSVFYAKINSALFAVRSKGNYRLGTLKTSTPFMTLYKKELRRLISSPIYAMNTCIGAVLLIVVSVAFLFINIEQIGNEVGLPDIMTWIKPMSPWIVTFFVAISTATSSSISLEGKSRWLMCSAPVTPTVIFNSKIAVSLSYLIPSIFISCTLLAISLQTGFIETIALFAIPLLYSVFISVVGLSFNLKFPKYDWTSEYHAVKQSVSVLATVGTGIGSVLVFYALTASLQAISAWIQLLAIILIIAATLVVYRRLTTKALYV